MNAGTLEVDLHGFNRLQAKRLIENELMRVKKDVYRVRVIHGSHGGIVLRDMVRKEFKKHPKVLRVELSLNPGETYLVLREI